MPRAEAAVIASRLATKLGCESVVLVGCARPPLITDISALLLVGFDEPRHISYASAVVPGGSWHPLGDPSQAIAALPSPLVVIATALLEPLAAEIPQILAAVPAAIVVDVDGSAGHGVEALEAAARQVEHINARCLRGELMAPLFGGSHRPTSPVLVIDDGHDPRPRALVETGLHGLRLDPAVDTLSPGARAARVCVVSYEVVGPSRTGGIGTANTSLAIALARAGHDVSLLFTGTAEDERPRRHWQQTFAAEGVFYDQLDSTHVEAIGTPNHNVRRAWATYEWVRERHGERPFDVIHGPEWRGHLAYIALAKRHGVAFDGAQIVVGVHSSTRWCAEANREPLSSILLLTDEYLERTATEAADVAVSPSHYMLAYLRSRGWVVPERSFVQPLVTSQAIRKLRGTLSDRSRSPDAQVNEIVFFGRLEVRKGIEVFCDALDELADGQVDRLAITFMGSSVRVGGEASTAYIECRSRGWPWPVKAMTDLSHHEAVGYLSEGARLAVMPSLVDNSPNTVYEALGLRIPMIVSRSGGTWELIAVADLARCTYQGRIEDDLLGPAVSGLVDESGADKSLATTLRRALEGGFTEVRPAVDPDASDACHTDWHAASANGALTRRQAARRAPRVSVLAVSATAAMPSSLKPVVAESDAEVVVAVGEEPEPQAGSRVRVVAAAGMTPGAALTVAAKAATGELLLVLPGAVVAESEAPAVLARAAARSSSEIFVFPVWDRVKRSTGEPAVVVPVGGPPLLGLSYAYCGTSGFAIRAETLRELGWFNCSSAVTAPGVDLINRAAAAGYRIDVVPKVIARRTRPDPLWALYNGRGWLGPVAWDVSAQEELELIRPFGRATTLAELPALHRGTQQLVAEQFEHERKEYRRLMEAHETTYAQLLHVQRSYDAVLAQAQHLQRTLDTLIASESALRAQVQSLSAQLEVVYSSRSWRVTSPLRSLRASRRQG